MSDPDDVERAGGRSGAGVPGKAGRERLRCFNRVGVALLALGTLFALGFAGYRHASMGLSTYDTSHAARARRTPFPLVAHEIWLGDEMPTVKRLLYERNKEILAWWGWELRLWGVGDIDAANFPHTHIALRRGLRRFETTGENVWSMVGDLMKFEILYRVGGLYLDTNVELLRDPSPLFWDTASAGKQAFFVADPGDNRFVSAGMIGAVEPGSALLGAVVTNGAYLDGVDFAQRCIANAVTGPVMLTAHLENEKKLLETVSIFDRDVAYPLACGENYLDPCVARLDREGDGEAGAGPDAFLQTKYAAATARADAAATARSMAGVGSSSLGAFARDNAPPAPPVGALRRVARTAADVAATAAKWREADEARREAEWRRNAVGATSSWRVVVENDGARWNATVPCRAVARAYPDSYAIDHFSVGGASWQQNCDRLEKAELMTKWVEEKTPADAKLVHDWAMSAVRFLGGPERGRAFVKRIRMHQTNGAGGRARLMLVASSLRAGGALLNEMLETTADHPVDSKIWYREDEARADAFFVTYVTLGDLWSHGAFERVREGSWQDKLRAYLLQAGVSRRAIDDAHVDPETFVEETLERLWESGIDVVHVMLTQSGAGLRSKVSESSDPSGSPPSVAGSSPGVANATSSPANANATTELERARPKNNTEVLEALLAKFPDSPTVCLRRRNVLDAYVSLYRAEHGDAPWQIVAEPPPAPTAGSAGSEKTRVREDAAASVTGVWGLGDDGEKAAKTYHKNGDDAEALTFSDGADGRANAEAFGAFGDVPGDGEDDPRRRQTHRVRFDPAVFAWLDAFETEWLDDVEAITKSAGDGRECESLVYEDALADEARQQKTLEWLNARFALGLNVEALPLQKLRRVNTSPVTLLDFENPDALDQRARSFLREPQSEEEDAAGETVDDYEPVGGKEKTRRLRVAFR